MESVKERMERIGAYEKIASFMQKEKQPYEYKRKYAQIRAEEFANECDGRLLNYHVSVGGTLIIPRALCTLCILLSSSVDALTPGASIPHTSCKNRYKIILSSPPTETW